MAEHSKSRHLHITIHESAEPSTGLGSSDPRPTAVSVPPPDDPSRTLVSVPPPDDPSFLFGGCSAGAPWAAVRATVQDCPPAQTDCCGSCGCGSCVCGSGRGSSRASTAEREDWSGFVIVRLDAGKRSPTAESLWQLAHELHLPSLASVLRLGFAEEPWGPGPHEDPPEEELFPPNVLYSRPLIDTGACSSREEVVRQIENAEGKASSTDLAPRYSLVSYWRVDARQHAELIPELIVRFQELAAVDLAYAEITATDPSFDSDQEYFERGPVGFGVRAAWERLDQNAAKVQICDLEQAWHIEHRDLQNGDNPLLSAPIIGTNRFDDDPSQGSHGTAVIGELGGIGAAAAAAAAAAAPAAPAPDAPQDDKRITGAASAFGSFLLASHYRKAEPTDPMGGTNGHVASAIAHAAVVDNPPLGKGDVLLIEVQRGGKPTEIADPADRDAIRLVSALGVIVIEAAGNGGVDLDRYRNPHSRRTLNPRDPTFIDSGAVLVGAAAAELPHDRKDFSCFGARVDCYAWGERVTTCGYGDLYGTGVADFYTDTFSGTSSASPMIAGAAALIQAFTGKNGEKLLPLPMREVLSDPQTGTPQGPNVPGAIGIMPDVSEIISRGLQLTEDSYLRRDPSDDGAQPIASGSLSSSPDIVVQMGKPASAMMQLGEGPQAHDPAPGEPVNSALFLNKSSDLNLYLRMRNRGGAPGQARIMVFTTPAATLSTSETWRFTTEFDISDIPVGDTLRVSAGSAFDQLKGLQVEPLKPPPSFLAVYRSTGSVDRSSLIAPWPHPLPPGPPYFRWREFLNFLRGPNVAWRNVHPVEVDSQGSALTLPFLFAGTPDRSRTFDFEIEQRLPADAALALQLTSNALQSKLVRNRPDLPKSGVIDLPRRKTEFPRVRIVPDETGAASFQVSGPLRTGHSLSIRQIWRGIEVGRVSWWFREAT